MLTTLCTSCRKPITGRRRDDKCNACYLRWLRAGKPDTVPPPAMPSNEQRTAQADEQANIARVLAALGRSVEDIAEDLGVSPRSVRRYLSSTDNGTDA